MQAFTSTFIQFLSVLPATALACLPVKSTFRFSLWKTALIVAFANLVFAAGGGALCQFFSIPVMTAALPVYLCSGLVYLWLAKVSVWKSGSIFLAVCAVFSCFSSLTRALDFLLFSGGDLAYFSVRGALLFLLLCVVFLTVVWYPSSRPVREMLDDDVFAWTWYIFWILPILFIAFHVFIVPKDADVLNTGRLLWIYLVFSLVSLLLLLLFYGLFFLMASSLNKNYHLKQKNQFLAMQKKQYNYLAGAIEETRRARHDLRHHFSVLSGLAERGDLDAVLAYLSQVRETIPDRELNLCHNLAVDSVAGYYAAIYRKENIPFSCAIDLPDPLLISEPDLCIVLANLLENALEASRKVAPDERSIDLQIYRHSDQVLILRLENAFHGQIQTVDGVFQSSKRAESGIGLQSVAHIAEKNGGHCKFTFNRGIFTANILLRADSGASTHTAS